MVDENTKIGQTDTTIYAHWIKLTYRINFGLEGGTIPIGSELFYSIDYPTFTLPIPTKVGYTFVGWTGSNGDIPQDIVTIESGSIGDRLYTAHWKENIGMSFRGEESKYYQLIDNRIIVNGAGGFSGQVSATLEKKIVAGDMYELEFICDADTSVIGFDGYSSGVTGELENKGNNRYIYTFTTDNSQELLVFYPYIIFNNIEATHTVTVNLYKLEY